MSGGTTASPDAARSAADPRAVAERLRATFASGRTKSLAWRRSQLTALRRMLGENRGALEDAVRADLGKPAAETLLMEIDLVMDEARFVRRRMAGWSARKPKPMHWLLQPAFAWTLDEPKGVALIISPWNYPVLLSLEPLADAIAAGNAVCLKPSELSPATSALIARLVADYLDPEAFAVVQGGPEETTALLEQPFDHIFYTGGRRVGRIVMEAAARHLTPVTLELGGKSPCFVDDTVDLNTAARRIAWGKFTNAGQTCVAPDYVLATPGVAEMLARRIAVAVTEFYGEDPRRSPDFARIVNDRHFQRMTGLMEGAGQLVCGGETDRAERYVAPTVFLGTPPDAPVMGEEIFGPILPVVIVRDVDEAIAFINARSHPLAAYVFSHSREVRRRFERDTSSGALGYGLPLGHLISSRLPFGGVGFSGMGAYHGREGFRVFSHTKTVVDKPLFPDTLRLVYPPFTKLRERLVRVLAKLS